MNIPIEYVALMVPVSIAFFAIWMEHRRKMMAKQLEFSAGQTTQNASNVRELELRVRVLERIITDRGFDVSQKIEDLRDTPQTKRLN